MLEFLVGVWLHRNNICYCDHPWPRKATRNGEVNKGNVNRTKKRPADAGLFLILLTVRQSRHIFHTTKPVLLPDVTGRSMRTASQSKQLSLPMEGIPALGKGSIVGAESHPKFCWGGATEIHRRTSI